MRFKLAALLSTLSTVPAGVLAQEAQPAQAPAAPAAPAVVPATPELPPGAFKIPGTNTTLRFNGFVQLDLTEDFKGRDPMVEGDDWATVAALVPLDNSYETQKKANQLYLTARTSRFGLTTNTPSDAGAIGVRLEGDFNSGNLLSGQTFTNSTLFRIRHAYGTISGSAGTLLTGQTWSTFADLNSMADTVDFNGPGSVPMVRQAMIRYSVPVAEGVTIAVAAENSPGTDQNGVTDSGSTTKLQRIPDFVATVTAAGGWGSARLAGVTMQYKHATASDGSTNAYAKQGYGAALSGAFNVAGDKVVAHVEGGSGIGRYLFNAGLTGQGLLSADELWDAVAYHVGYTHNWSPVIRSNVIVSQTFFKDNGELTGDNLALNKRIDQGFVNTFWSFAKNAQVGVEYVYGQRRTFVGDKGTMHRVNVQVHYDLF